jgi:adenylosuccinate lyase
MAGVVREAVLPLLKRLERLLCDFAGREAETPQVGRTHGQHAVPITLGFAAAEYVSRLGKSILEIEKRAKELKGKLAGAKGTAVQADRMRYLHQAEDLLVGADYAVGPIYFYTQMYMINPALSGMYYTPWDTSSLPL